MNYGFIIDNRKCIGCHACSVACKAENQVPVGANRTWVKYVEKGEFPDTRRLFSVNRCNHCANPPCVTICPVTALHKRPDGIVDLDQDLCIGCKGCLQACPYDALYIHPDRGTAQKCHYCAHRVEKSLEPPCVVVCPEHAIISGDMDDPQSEIAQLLSREQTTVRKPEQGTRPKLFYIDGDSASLSPLAAPPDPGAYMWSTTSHSGHGKGGFLLEPGEHRAERRWQPGPEFAETLAAASGEAAPAVALAAQPAGRAFADLEVPAAPLLELAEAARLRFQPARRVTRKSRLRRTHDVGHEKPWGVTVTAYIFTKSIAAGAFLVAALLALTGRTPMAGEFQLAAGGVSLLFLAITTALLVADLERPERFLSILLRPQWRSWLAIGAFILTGYAIALSGWLVTAFLGLDALAELFFWPAIPLAIASAVYTAFLLAQAEGRDFWQSPALAPGLLLHALGAGCATAIAIALLSEDWRHLLPFLGWLLAGTLAADLFVVLAGELYTSHASADAAAAAKLIKSGVYAPLFWIAVVGLGHVLAIGLLLLAPGEAFALALAAGLSALGLVAWSHCFIEAGQAIPLS